MWVYIKTEANLWTVGFYAPDGQWHTDSDHANSEEAAKRCAWLNGSLIRSDILPVLRDIAALLKREANALREETANP